MKNILKVSSVFIVILLLTGCANTGVVNLEPNKYMIKNTDKGGVFSDGSKLIPEVTNEAKSFASKEGKLLEIISDRYIPVAPGRLASYELTFKLVDKVDIKSIPPSIPSTFEGFQYYLKQNSNNSFEGIWEFDNNKFTLGMLHTPKDVRYKYRMFIIESDNKKWKQGNILIDFYSLANNNITKGKAYQANGGTFDLVCTTKEKFINCTSKSLKNEIFIFKVYPSDTEQVSKKGIGTGWAISEDGMIVTNAHVVKGAKEIFVGFKDKNPLKAKVLIIDNQTDLVVLKVNSSKPFKPIPINFNQASNGSEITVVGYPLAFTLGDDARVTNGIVNAQSGIGKDASMYQISAPVQPGNSGGPIFNHKGEVIAIVVGKLADSSMQVVNFGIKATYLEPLLKQIKFSTLRSNNNDIIETTEIFNKYKDSILPVWTEE